MTYIPHQTPSIDLFRFQHPSFEAITRSPNSGQGHLHNDAEDVLSNTTAVFRTQRLLPLPTPSSRPYLTDIFFSTRLRTPPQNLQNQPQSTLYATGDLTATSIISELHKLRFVISSRNQQISIDVNVNKLAKLVTTPPEVTSIPGSKCHIRVIVGRPSMSQLPPRLDEHTRTSYECRSKILLKTTYPEMEVVYCDAHRFAQVKKRTLEWYKETRGQMTSRNEEMVDFE